MTSTAFFSRAMSNESYAISSTLREKQIVVWHTPYFRSIYVDTWCCYIDDRLARKDKEEAENYIRNTLRRWAAYALIPEEKITMPIKFVDIFTEPDEPGFF